MVNKLSSDQDKTIGQGADWRDTMKDKLTKAKDG